VVKLLSCGKRTVREVALELNVSYHTAKNWLERKPPGMAAMRAGQTAPGASALVLLPESRKQSIPFCCVPMAECYGVAEYLQLGLSQPMTASKLPLWR